MNTGMYDYRSRMYSPGAGRFMKRDAPQFLGIEVNPYRYVNNRPTLFGDPFGFTSCITCGYAYSMSEEHCRVLAGTYKVGGMSYKDCMRTADKGYHYCMSICNGGGDNPWNQKYYDQWKRNTEKLNRMRDNCELTAHEYEEMKRNMDRGHIAAVMFTNTERWPWYSEVGAYIWEIGSAEWGTWNPVSGWAWYLVGSALAGLATVSWLTGISMALATALAGILGILYLASWLIQLIIWLIKWIIGLF